MDTTYVPNLDAADGQLGTGSNMKVVSGGNMDPTYVPNPDAADGIGVVVSGSSNIFSHDGNPNGVQSCTGPGIVLGEGSSLGDLWVKLTNGTSSTDWILIISL